MKRLTILAALTLVLAALAPAALADDVDEGAPETMMDEKEPSDAQLWKAEMIADYFSELWGDAPEVAVDDVMAIRTGENETIGHPVGWGALYKLMLYLGPGGLDEFDFEDGLAIGKLRKAYYEGLEEGTEPGVKNLGQLHKANKDHPAKPGKSGSAPGQLKKGSG